MRVNTDHNTMDMEARDINYWLQVYMLSYLLESRNADPVEIVVPMFPSVTHPRNPEIKIPVKWIDADSPMAAEIARDGSKIPETPVEESTKADEQPPTEAAKEVEKEPAETVETDGLSPAKAALARQKADKDEASPEKREPKLPPLGDIGPGQHPDGMDSRDAGFDRRIASDLKPERSVDESKEQPIDIEKPKE